MTAPRIAVALSGGVDSAVAAALLVQQGEDVIGLMLRLDDAADEVSRCCSPEDMALARRVAERLSIPFYVLPAAAAFREAVIGPFIYGYAHGLTPNPCLACNRHIRWGLLLDHALSLGASCLASGHYARIASTPSLRLLRGVDPAKDQSYVLAFLTQAQLSHALFPLGTMTKQQVRAVARTMGLPVADRAESQDLCFVPSRDYRSFLREHLGPLLPGPILDTQGRQIGTHPGLADYTIGQRKGIAVSSSEALYVVSKDLAANTITVGPRAALARHTFRITEANWISGLPPAHDAALTVRVRYHDQEVRATFEGESDGGLVHLAQPLSNVTPGQAAVFYAGEECLGGGIIQS
jgi:tRNA-specific 2-thiouridylase